jgi:DNA adenine methylase
MISKSLHPTPRPFLKWAGGKGQLLPELTRMVSEASPFTHYHEPFVGGGALFFELSSYGSLKEKAYLSDNNEHLIEAYRSVRNDVDALILLLREHKELHSHDYYYHMRANIPEGVTERGARIIYLNKTCFNGLFRENRKGEFNVPMGRYANPMICDEENLRACAKALKKSDVKARPFESVLQHARAGDFVYFDPPYIPLSATANFTGYGKGGFAEDSQRCLADVFEELDRKGVKVLLSNSETPLARRLYKKFRVENVYATRLVNSRADRRGKVPEILARNY